MASNGEWELSAQDVECLAIGAGILGCGGGGDPNYGRLRAQQLLEEGKKIKVVNPCRYTCTCSYNMCTLGVSDILIETCIVK